MKFTFAKESHIWCKYIQTDLYHFMVHINKLAASVADLNINDKHMTAEEIQYITEKIQGIKFENGKYSKKLLLIINRKLQ